MSTIYQFLAALILAYFTRRLFQIVLGRVNLPLLGRDIAANLLSFLVWTLIAGFTKVYTDSFNGGVATIWAVAQAPWLLLDLFNQGRLTFRR